MNHPDQLVIFAEPRARHDDPPTATDAAAKAKPTTAERVRRVTEIIDEAGAYGATADEVYDVLNRQWPRSSCHKRVCDALNEGRIVEHPKGNKRLSENGRLMRVYVTPQHKGT